MFRGPVVRLECRGTTEYVSEVTAYSVPLAQILDSVGTNFDGHLSQNSHAFYSCDANNGHVCTALLNGSIGLLAQSKCFGDVSINVLAVVLVVIQETSSTAYSLWCR
jgi:hypothetical protein